MYKPFYCCDLLLMMFAFLINFRHCHCLLKMCYFFCAWISNGIFLDWDAWQGPLDQIFLWISLTHLTQIMSHAETIINGKTKQILKMTTVFTQNGPGWKKLSFWVKRVVILWICSVFPKGHTTVIYYLENKVGVVDFAKGQGLVKF